MSNAPRVSWGSRRATASLSGTITFVGTIDASDEFILGPFRLDSQNNPSNDATAQPILGWEEVWSIATEESAVGGTMLMVREFSINGAAWFLQGQTVIVVPGRVGAISPNGAPTFPIRRFPAYPYFRIRLVNTSAGGQSIDIVFVTTFRAPHARLV
jgi:hypothetical protein